MAKFTFRNPRFITSAVREEGYPSLRNPSGKEMPEVALMGRSNVGKSSLINHFFGCKGLAKTSSTPGKTQLLNFFTVNDAWSFVDLPGYGYAKAPLSARKDWGKMIETYLKNRKSLKLFLFLFDIRRSPNEEDHQLIEWLAYSEKKWILVLTKVDKVSPSEKLQNTQRILEAFGRPLEDCVHYSTTKDVGRDDLLEQIRKGLED